MAEKKVVLVTGASSGIGLAIAQRLAEAGHKVFGTSRAPNGQQPAKFTLLRLDVRSDESVRTCVESILSEAGRIDVLVNNAAYVLLGAVEESPLDQAKDLFETNFFGAVRMCQAVLPSMRKQGRGQIINITSLAGLNPVPFWGLYNASKFALEGLSESMRHELKPLNIDVALVEPAFYKSNLRHNTHRSVNRIADYEPSRKRAEARIRECHEAGPEPSEVAETVLKIVESKKSPKLRHLLGKEVVHYRLRQWMPSGAYENVARGFWNLDGEHH